MDINDLREGYIVLYNNIPVTISAVYKNTCLIRDSKGGVEEVSANLLSPIKLFDLLSNNMNIPLGKVVENNNVLYLALQDQIFIRNNQIDIELSENIYCFTHDIQKKYFEETEKKLRKGEKLIISM